MSGGRTLVIGRIGGLRRASAPGSSSSPNGTGHPRPGDEHPANLPRRGEPTETGSPSGPKSRPDRHNGQISKSAVSVLKGRHGGSSPRERGTLARGRGGELDSRIIPARAGNTTRIASRVTMFPDHPRASGEHRRRGDGRAGVAGSSPRERGTLWDGVFGAGPWRIIPARAGNTFSRTILPVRNADHPRASGEHLGGIGTTPHHYGSSPRERGTRWCRRQTPGRCRIIPARAGNTRRARQPNSQRTDHPRASGEHVVVRERP